MEKTAIIILAAGQGKRMFSELPKVAISSRERPLVQHVLSSAQKLSPERVVVVTGHKREMVEDCVKKGALPNTYSLEKLTFAVQEKQLGTGDAVRAAENALKGFVGTVIILAGDAPLLTAKTLESLVKFHHEKSATVTLLSFTSPPPNAYGRVLRDEKTQLVKKVVEAKDCSTLELQISEANSSIYAVDSSFLWPALKQLKNENAQGEYYLTDIVEHANKEGQTAEALLVHDADELQGVNDQRDLAEVNRILNKRRISELLLSGVILEDPSSLYIESTVQITAGARIGPNVQLRGTTVIEAGAQLEGNSYLKNTHVGKDAIIKFSVRCENAEIGESASVGPFAHLRPGTKLGKEVKVGNFVETKNAVLADGAKASHLSYLGDCTIGEDTNIGAGTITCNYDGYNKFKTTIGKNVFVGSNSSLVAPVTLEDGVSIGAGSVIAKTTIPADALAVTRAALVVKEGWSKKQKSASQKK